MTTPEVDAERKLFEAWCVSRGGISTGRDSTPKENGGTDEYDNAWTNHAWWAWQAARSLPGDARFVLVPKEPTNEMYLAACRAYTDWSHAATPNSMFTHNDVYRVMVKAATPAGSEGASHG